MDENERGELLIQIKEKLDNLIIAFDRVSNGAGFPRCVEREQRIKRLEQDCIEMKPKVAKIDSLDSRLTTIEIAEVAAKNKRERVDTWFVRLTWGAIIVSVLKFAFFPE